MMMLMKGPLLKFGTLELGCVLLQIDFSCALFSSCRCKTFSFLHGMLSYIFSITSHHSFIIQTSEWSVVCVSSKFILWVPHPQSESAARERWNEWNLKIPSKRYTIFVYTYTFKRPSAVHSTLPQRYYILRGIDRVVLTKYTANNVGGRETMRIGKKLSELCQSKWKWKRK